jgi:hypothetical protein
MNDASCPEGFECSCRPEDSSLSDGSYPRGRPGCLRIPYGRIGETNGGRPTTIRYGYVGYNNFAQALFTVFLVCASSNWTQIMDATMQAHGMAACYVFVVAVIIMRYWILNVASAIISSVYTSIRSLREAANWDHAMARAETALLEQLLAGDEHIPEDEDPDEADGVDAAKKRRSGGRQSKARAALVDKLGDLSSCTPRELTEHIRKTFEQFDEDGSGEISSSELAEAFRAMGMEIPDEDVEGIAADADMDGDGVLGIEEFEDMVKKMISTVRESEPESQAVAIKEEPPLFLGLFPIPEQYFHCNTVPLGKFSLAVARLMAAPKMVDECGQIVPGDVIFEAQRRNLVIQWGPKTREWSLMADRGGASIGMATRKDKQHQEEDAGNQGIKEMFPSKTPIPGGEGVSAVDDSRRSDIRQVLMQFDMHGKWRNEQPVLVSNNAVSYSDMVVLTSILANTLMMTLSHFQGTVDMDCKTERYCPHNLVIMKEGWFVALTLGEVGFNIVFTLEALAKIVALGSFMRYIVQPINTFDFLLVVVSDILMVLGLLDINLPNVSFFRALRLLRAFLMVTRFHRLRLLFRRSAKSLMGTLNVILLLFFFLAAFAIIGMQNFGCEVPQCKQAPGAAPGTCLDPLAKCTSSLLCSMFSEEIQGKAACSFSIRHNFNTFWNALSAMFVIFTGEDWVEIMTNGMRLHSSVSSIGIYSSIIFFTISYVFFNHIMANLFIAVIIDNFSTSEEVKTDLQESIFQQRMATNLKQRLGKKNKSQEDSNTMQQGDSNDLLAILGKHGENSKEDDDEEDVILFGCLLPPSSTGLEVKTLRGFARDILENAWYQRSILWSIIVSCVVLILDSPIPEYRRMGRDAAYYINIVTFVLHIVEMFLKILDHGIYWEHPQAYFRVSWNRLDFICILAQALDLADAFPGLIVIKVFRVLRPLRLLSRIKLLQILISVLTHSFADCIIIAIIFFFVIVVCAIFAQTLFAGYTYKCSDAGKGLRVSHLAASCDHSVDPLTCDHLGRHRSPEIDWREDCRGMFLSDHSETLSSTSRKSAPNYYLYKGDRNEVMRPRVWSVDANHNFDDFGSTLHTIMQVWSLNSWPEIALETVDARDYGRQPRFNQRPWVLVFFWIFIIISKFFITPLIVAVMLEHIAQEVHGTAIFTDLQRNWQRFEEKLAHLEPIVKPEVPINATQRMMWHFVRHHTFERTILTIIVVNTLLMTTDSYNGDPTWSEVPCVLRGFSCMEQALMCVAHRRIVFRRMRACLHAQPSDHQANISQVSWYLNIIFIACYAIEMICKLVAYSMGFFRYRQTYHYPIEIILF